MASIRLRPERAILANATRRRATCLLLGAMLGGGLLSQAGAQSVRDSAGVRIVENTHPALPAACAWRLDRAPALQTGVLSGDSLYEFLRVMGVVRLTNGRIAVANQGSSTIRFFFGYGGGYELHGNSAWGTLQTTRRLDVAARPVTGREEDD